MRIVFTSIVAAAVLTLTACSAKAAGPSSAVAAGPTEDASTVLTEDRILHTLAVRALVATSANTAVTCQGIALAAKGYEITRMSSEGRQQAALFVYPNSAAVGADWKADGLGSEAPRRGTCSPAAKMYGNRNAVLVIPDGGDQALGNLLSAAFLAATP